MRRSSVRIRQWARFFAINHSVRFLFLLLSIEYYTFIARPALLDLINLHDYERETFDGGGGGGVASATSPNCTSDAFDLSSSSFMKLVRSMFALGLVCFFFLADFGGAGASGGPSGCAVGREGGGPFGSVLC